WTDGTGSRTCCGARPVPSATGRRATAQKSSDLLSDEPLVGRRRSHPGHMAPQRGNGSEGDVLDESRLVLGVAHGKVEICCAGHVEHRDLDGPKGRFGAPTHSRRG